MAARTRLILAILALLAVLMVGAAGYMWIEVERGLTFTEAAYMTVITLSTVGFGEPWELSPTARLWTVLIIVFGIVTVSFAVSSLVSLVVGGELRSLQEQKKMEKTLKRLRNHVILCGLGRMGELVVKELMNRGVPLVVIDHDQKLTERLQAMGVPYIVGDATEDETLERAGLMRARALVIATASDSDNVYVTLTVHTMRPELTIVARAEQPSTEAKLLRAGASRVVCPQATGALKIADVLTRPAVVDFVELANKGVDLEIDEYRVSPDSHLVGKTLRDSQIRGKIGAIAVAIKRADGEAIVNPDPDASLSPGDTLILVGPAGVSGRLDALGSGT